MTRARRRRVVVPPPLAPGARVAVVAPGSVVRPAALDAGLRVLRRWGFEPVEARGLRARRGDLAGTDAARLEDLVEALTGSGIDAVWAARGGWGAARLLDALSRRVRRPRPRWLIGFSDVTALQLWLLERGVASLYAPLVGELADRGRYVASDLRAALITPRAPRVLRARRGLPLVEGRARGRVVAACLSVLAALCGTRHAPPLRGAILVLEDVGEAPYRIDRMLWQLRSSGVLDGVRGLAFGQFTACRPARGRPSRPLRAILREHAGELGVPSIAGLPVGHGRRARCVPIGFEAELDAGSGRLAVVPPAAR